MQLQYALKPDSPRQFAARLIAWQRAHGRHDLPWQNTRDAYRIWLSEIMLQQTQVSTVIAYYERFLARFPTLDDLARAPIEAVVEPWAGLGYYARARNLHRCAQTIVAEYGGQFPEDPSLITTLPGIGRSTAAAIAVFAFGARAAILDGNVKRVLARCFGIAGLPGSRQVETAMWSLADALLPEAHIEAYTQGLMDLGSAVCTRRRPLCDTCPMRGVCIAQEQGRQVDLPLVRPKKALPERQTTMLLLTDGQRVLLERRPPTGIWGGLLALPERASDELEQFARQHGCRVLETHTLPGVRHTFTHFRLNMDVVFCRVDVSASLVSEPGWKWLAYAEIGQAALPTPVRRLLRTVATTSYD